MKEVFEISGRSSSSYHRDVQIGRMPAPARWDALAGMTDQTNGSPYGPSEVPLSYFNAAGRVLKTLRDAGIEHDDLVQLTTRIAMAASEDNRPERCDDDKFDVPF